MSAVEIEEVFSKLGIEANLQTPYGLPSATPNAPAYEIVFSTESNPFGK